MLRAMWTGVITFGLVKVPVKAYKLDHPHDLKANQLHGADGGRVTFNRLCQACGEGLEYKELVNGYPAGNDRYVVVSDADRASLMPETATGMTIDRFCDASEIDASLFESTSILSPDKGGAAAYGLLLHSMAGMGVAGVGTVMMRERAYLATVRARAGYLTLSTLLYADELLDSGEIESIRDLKVEPNKDHLLAAAQLIEMHTGPFEHATHRDVFRDRLQALIEQRATDGEVLSASSPAPASGDLMAALEASIAAAPKRRRARSKGTPIAPSQKHGEPPRPRAKRPDQGTRTRLPQPGDPKPPEQPELPAV